VNLQNSINQKEGIKYETDVNRSKSQVGLKNILQSQNRNLIFNNEYKK
jgi:hypothetical protein